MLSTEQSILFCTLYVAACLSQCCYLLLGVRTRQTLLVPMNAMKHLCSWTSHTHLQQRPHTNTHKHTHSSISTSYRQHIHALHQWTSKDWKDCVVPKFLHFIVMVTCFNIFQQFVCSSSPQLFCLASLNHCTLWVAKLLPIAGEYSGAVKCQKRLVGILNTLQINAYLALKVLKGHCLLTRLP